VSTRCVSRQSVLRNGYKANTAMGRDIMRQHLPRVLLCLALVVASLACTSKLVGPTGSSGYFFSLSSSPPQIWLNSLAPTDLYPTFAELSVQVRNAQGQPVDGVPVEFQIEPEWANSASIEPPRTTTRGGVAQAIFRAKTIGVVRVSARVEDTIQQTRIIISVYNPGPGGGA
jgi:hypothetical protein